MVPSGPAWRWTTATKGKFLVAFTAAVVAGLLDIPDRWLSSAPAETSIVGTGTTSA